MKYDKESRTRISMIRLPLCMTFAPARKLPNPRYSASPHSTLSEMSIGTQNA